MNVSFRLALESDIELILGMMEDFYAIDQYPFDPVSQTASLNIFIDNEHLGRIWLIETNEVIGYVALTFGFSFEYGGRDAFIDELYIKATHRGMGIGRRALEFIDSQVEHLNIKATHLEVEKQNDIAHKLYLSNGYLPGNRKLLTKKTIR